ncbi:MAG: VOC family protein [Anaerolineae bacterium]|nr:VOC family protein [Anaerolineae bacterium]
MRIESITLVCGDIGVAEKFYAQQLGLPISASTPDHIGFKVGDSQLHFFREHDRQRTRYHFAFNIPENQLAEAKAWIAERTPLISDAGGKDEFDFPNWNAHSIYFSDPFGNILEVIARHDLKNGSTTAFSSRSLLSISEIGLPCEDVPAQVDQLRQQLQIGIFRNSNSAEFAAIGTDEGLAIIVKQGREWYPNTGVLATDRPLEVRCTDSSGQLQVVT